MAALAKIKVVSRRVHQAAMRRHAATTSASASAPVRSRVVLVAHRRRRSASSCRASRRLSIQKFGLAVLADRRPGIRSPASSARCRSSGARSIRRCSRCSSPTPIALGIAVFISELCPTWLRQPLVFLTELLAAIPSIVYGLWGIFVLVPLVRRSRSALPESLRQLPLFSGPPLGVGMLSAALILADHGRSRSPRRSRAKCCKAVPQAQREGGLRARRHALGGDSRGALLRAHRHRRRRSCSASAARSARRWR